MKNIKFRKKKHFDIRTNVIMYIIIEKQQYINYAVFVVKKLLPWAHKTSLAPSRFIEVPVLSQESQHSCICVFKCINFASFYDFSIGFWNSSVKKLFHGNNINICLGRLLRMFKVNITCLFARNLRHQDYLR
jgi:hypothetical protein